jgi:hypothetical protein
LFLVLLVCAGFYSSWGRPSSAIAAEANEYPSIEAKKEMGAINYLLKLANQAPGDWSGMGFGDQAVLQDLRYQLGFMFYALALVQYHKTPAYRELYQPALDKLIQKFMRWDVWSYWYDLSETTVPPLTDNAGCVIGWADPVKSKNIMYSGYIMQMVGLYRMLYGDTKYDADGSIAFVDRSMAPGRRGTTYTYNYDSLVKLAYDQFMNNPWHGIECEPNFVFAPCNQPPHLALLLHDGMKGTNWFAPANAAWMGQWDTKGYYNTATHRVMMFYLIVPGVVVPNPAPYPGLFEGFVGLFMNAYDPGFVQTEYPYQKALLHVESDGTIAANNWDGSFPWLAQ